MFFISLGTLKYSDNPYKLIVEVEQSVSDYYKSLVPKYINLKKPAFSAHISVIRTEPIPLMEFWNKYDGEKVLFSYENVIYNDELYYWLNAYCPKLEEIREELGMPKTSNITYSPDGKHRFHITIGNLKVKT